MAGWKQTSARGFVRRGNSPYKTMLESLGFSKTDTKYLKDWIKKRSKGFTIEEEKVTVIFGDKVIQTKTVAEAVWIMYVKYGIK